MKEYLFVQLPFSGFYETWHSQILDDAIESDYRDEMGVAPDDFWSEVEVKWTEVHAAYAKVYAETVLDKLGEVDDSLTVSKPVMDLILANLKLQSPKEYNFDTDHIYAPIPTSEVTDELTNWMKTVHRYVQDHQEILVGVKDFQVDRTEYRSGYIPRFDLEQVESEWDECDLYGQTFPHQFEESLDLILSHDDEDYQYNLLSELSCRGHLNFVHQFIKYEESENE